MTIRFEAASGLAPLSGPATVHGAESALLGTVLGILDDAKAEDVVAIDLRGKSPLGDHMVVASGRSQRHVGAVAAQLVKKLKDRGHKRVRVEGVPQCDWVLIDTGDVIVHVFRPEARSFYNLEKMWSADRPPERLAV